MRNNELLKNALEKMREDYTKFIPDTDVLLDYNYFQLTDDTVKDILDSEIDDAILAFVNEVFDLGFKLGVDTVLELQAKDPVFEILKELNESDNG